MSWWQERMVGFDLETTSPLPEQARIVSAALAGCGGGLPTDAKSWLCDPGVEIPEGAAAVHGITTERARAEGMDAGELVERLVIEVFAAVTTGIPLVVFNARYDLTVLDRESRRHLGRPLVDEKVLDVTGSPYFPMPVTIDPFVIDKQLDRFRKGKRTLAAICEAYGATLDGAHDAVSDAIAACRAAWVLGAKGRVRRQIRHYGGHERADRVELAELSEEWEAVRGSAPALHEAQRRWALAERERFAEYRRGEVDKLALNRGAGDAEVEAALADCLRIEMEHGWPVLDVMDHEEV